MRKSKIAVLGCLLCLGCFSRSAYLTQESYAQIQVGEPVDQVVKEYGDPYAVDTKKDGTKEYKYIETLSTGNRLVYENHYILVVKDGKIIEKKQWQEQNPPYELIYQDDPNHHHYP